MRLLLAGAAVLIFASAAVAQDAIGVIEQRIERTFNLVIGNSPELAVPLTRRALARRSTVEEQANEPLAYHEPSASDVSDSTDFDARQVVAEGDAEDPEDEIDVARLPRPRPDSGAGDEPAADDAPLDLVAGAPAPPIASDLLAAAAPAEAPKAETLVAAAPAAADQPILPAPTSQPAAELVASGACLSPGDIEDKDGDFQRNADALSGNGFCITEERFKERRRPWTIQTVKTSRPGPLWAVMHDDEDMSFDNAVAALAAYGGTLVTVDTGGKRNQDGIDPNRNFSADGIGCKKLGNDAAPKYTGFFRALMSEEPIIALHNNTGEDIPTGGLGHVSMESVPKGMEVVEAADPKGPLAGERALVLLASPVPVSTTSERRARALSAKGINAMIELVDDGDCSLSNYALLTGHADYLNVTVDHDERDKQRKIIDAIMAGRNTTVATQ